LTKSLQVDGFVAPPSGASSPAIAGSVKLLRLIAPSASSANLVRAVMPVVRIVFCMLLSSVGRKRRGVGCFELRSIEAWMKSAARHVSRIGLWYSA
jgi:hypothetical protein